MPKPAKLPPAEQLARDLLDWDAQFGPVDAKETSACEVAPEDMVRWIELARRIRAGAAA